MYDCNISKNFWIEVFGLWNVICPDNIVYHDIKLVTFGMYDDYSNPDLEIINLLLLLGKYFIWQCRFKKSNPSIPFIHPIHDKDYRYLQTN